MGIIATILIIQSGVTMSKIQKISNYLLMVFNVLLIVIPLFVVLQWLLIDTHTIKILLESVLLHAPISTPEGYVDLSTVKWTLFTKTIGFCASILSLIPVYLSLFALKSTFKNYQQGSIFSLVNAKHYQYLGWLFLLNALFAKPISDMLMVIAVTLSNLPGHRYISISFGIPNLEAVFCGILLIVISWVMLEASKIHD